MDTNLACQIVDHVHAIIALVLGYVQKQGIPLDDDDYAALRFHLRRINALLAEVGYPLQTNPIISDASYHGKDFDDSDDNLTEPGKVTRISERIVVDELDL